jgi:general L-amino acid transport system permease protein
MSTTQIPASTLEPPRQNANVLVWLRKNLFNGWLNSVITIVLLWLIGVVVYNVVRWAVVDAYWEPVIVNLRLLMAGLYPPDQLWRVQASAGLVIALFGLSGGLWGGILRSIAYGLTAITAVLALVPLGLPIQLFWGAMALLAAGGVLIGRQVPRLRVPVLVLWLLAPWICLLLIRGIAGLLPVVDTRQWGGLLLTIILAVFPIVFSFPLGVLLALGRRSRLPVVKGFCVLYIEVIRGVPLLTVLFMGAFLLPLFLPTGWNPDNLLRALVALTLFSAAYLAENVRGGLQAVPNGQIEAARALGLNVFQSTLLIVLPQALRAVIPAIVGQFVSLFKDTSLVAILAFTELLGIASVITQQPAWRTVTGGVQTELYVFVGLIYWTFCFTIVQVSRRIERNLGVGTR